MAFQLEFMRIICNNRFKWISIIWLCTTLHLYTIVFVVYSYSIYMKRSYSKHEKIGKKVRKSKWKNTRLETGLPWAAILLSAYLLLSRIVGGSIVSHFNSSQLPVYFRLPQALAVLFISFNWPPNVTGCRITVNLLSWSTCC